MIMQAVSLSRTIESTRIFHLFSHYNLICIDVVLHQYILRSATVVFMALNLQDTTRCNCNRIIKSSVFSNKHNRETDQQTRSIELL